MTDTKESGITVKTKEVDGNIVRDIVSPEGAVVMTLSESFSEKQCLEVYKIAEQSLNQGVSYGVQRVQADLKRILGIVDSTPQNDTQET